MSKTDELTNEASAIRKPVSGIAEQGGSGAIAQLIQQYCPNGVEWKKLGEVCIKTENIKWKTTTRSFRYIDLSSVDIQTHQIISTTEIDKTSAPSRAQQIVQENDVIFATTRPTQMRLCIIPKEYNREICSTGYCVLRPDTDIVLPRFLFFVLGVNEFKIYLSNNLTMGNYPSISNNTLKEYEIPVPPLVVQEEIVKILDRFAVYAAELQAELQARQQQYQFYRDRLLSFEGRDDVQWKKLGEVCEFIKDGTHGSYKNVENGYPLLSAKDINNGIIKIPVDCRKISIEDYNAIYKNYKLLQGDVLITIVGSIGRTAVVRDSLEVAFQRSVGILRPTYKILSSYLSYILRTSSSQKQLTTKTNKSAQGGIYLGELNKIEIPVPPLEEQQRIVDILDRFDTLVNDLSQGLPAEIEARQKQYEFYRGRLLTFRRKE